MTGNREKYQWGKGLQELDPHSVAKHRILRSYLQQYVRILAQHPTSRRLTLSVVDGFCGAGAYYDPLSNDTVDGSPLIFLKTIPEAAEEVNHYRTKILGMNKQEPFTADVHYYFIDRNKHATESLTSRVIAEGFKHLISAEKCKILKKPLMECIDDIISEIEKRPGGQRAIFFLDQYGYGSVPLKKVREILDRLPNAEIILTFASDSLITFLSQNESIIKGITNAGLNPSKLMDIEAAKHEIDWRPIIEAKLSRELVLATGAKFYTPFFIRSRKSNWAYWLVHLSSHSRARAAMVDVHWENHNEVRHHGGSGLNMLGYDPFLDPILSNVPQFDFSKGDETASRDTLVKDLAHWLYEMDHPMSFQQIVDLTSNGSPARIDMYQDTLMTLQQEQDAAIQTKNGGSRRVAKQIRKDDIVMPLKEKRLFYRLPLLPKKMKD